MNRPAFWFPDADQFQAVAYLSVIGFVVYCVGNFLNLALPVFYVSLMWLSLGSSCMLLLSWWANRPAREACQLLVYDDEVFQNRFAVADKLGSLFVPILLGGFSKTGIMCWWVVFCILATLSGRIPVDKHGKPDLEVEGVNGSPRSSIYAAPGAALLGGFPFFILGGLVWLGLAFLLQAFFKKQPNDYSYLLIGQWCGLLLVVTIAEMIAGHARRVRLVWANTIPERESLVRAELMKEGIAAPAPEVVDERIRQRWGLSNGQRLPFGFILDFSATLHGLADWTFQFLGMVATWPVIMAAALGRVSRVKAAALAADEARQRQNRNAQRFAR